MKNLFNIMFLTTMLIFTAGILVVTNPQQTVNMVKISGGYYYPLYSTEENLKEKVEPFLIDKYAVTNEDFLDFVKANPKWQRSKVKTIFADKFYLKHWKADLKLGADINPKSPVTNLSWFAAKAYADWVGKRLPSLAEWEFVAQASKDRIYAADDPETISAIQEWYSKRTPEKLPAVGSTDKNYWEVYDMFGLIWEWNSDFNTAMVTGESRGDSDLDRNLFCGSSAANAKNLNNYPAFMRYAFRSSLKANYTVHNLGFRCAKDIN
jgi:formylglycine-generating enzyme